jgi:hypothetical protein
VLWKYTYHILWTEDAPKTVNGKFRREKKCIKILSSNSQILTQQNGGSFDGRVEVRGTSTMLPI